MKNAVFFLSLVLFVVAWVGLFSRRGSNLEDEIQIIDQPPVRMEDD